MITDFFDVVMIYEKNESVIKPVKACSYLGALNEVETTGVKLDDPLIKEILIRKTKPITNGKNE